MGGTRVGEPAVSSVQCSRSCRPRLSRLQWLELDSWNLPEKSVHIEEFLVDEQIPLAGSRLKPASALGVWRRRVAPPDQKSGFRYFLTFVSSIKEGRSSSTIRAGSESVRIGQARETREGLPQLTMRM